MSDVISSIKLRDLEIFLEVSRAKSIREVARRMQTTPGQISKTIQHLETKVGTKIYKRSVSGVLLTAQGAEILEIANTIVRSSESLRAMLGDHGTTKVKKTLALASTSFLNTHVTTPIASEFGGHHPYYSFRFLDLAPDQLVPVALRGGFEIAVHFGSISWPTTWVTNKLGKSKWVLVARFDHPIATRSTLRQILEHPFVSPVYWTQEGLTRGNDQFPVAVAKRKLGYETATADAAVPIVMKTNQLSFLPEVLVRSFVANKSLKIINCREVGVVERELYLSARSDIVPDKIFNGLSESIGRNL